MADATQAMLEMAKAFAQPPPFSAFGAAPQANPWAGGDGSSEAEAPPRTAPAPGLLDAHGSEGELEREIAAQFEQAVDSIVEQGAQPGHHMPHAGWIQSDLRPVPEPEAEAEAEAEPEVEPEPSAPEYPKHWGEPPVAQTRDYRPLPGGYGMGSGTLAAWITEKMAVDASAAGGGGGGGDR